MKKCLIIVLLLMGGAFSMSSLAVSERFYSGTFSIDKGKMGMSGFSGEIDIHQFIDSHSQVNLRPEKKIFGIGRFYSSNSRIHLSENDQGIPVISLYFKLDLAPHQWFFYYYGLEKEGTRGVYEGEIYKVEAKDMDKMDSMVKSDPKEPAKFWLKVGNFSISEQINFDDSLHGDHSPAFPRMDHSGGESNSPDADEGLKAFCRSVLSR